jgi:hypothetical protein
VSEQPGYPYPQTPWPQPAMPRPPVLPGPPMVPGGFGFGVRPERIEAIPGTEFGLAYAAVYPISSGQAVGALVAGMGSIVVSFVTIAFGLGGSSAGWGPMVAGAFGILSILLGAAAICVGALTMKAVTAARGAVRGRGLAKTGLICGIVGVSLTFLGFGGSLALTFA